MPVDDTFQVFVKVQGKVKKPCSQQVLPMLSTAVRPIPAASYGITDLS